MIKKRFLVAFLVCSILICHVGCGKAENSTGAQTDMETEQKETEANAGAETNNDGKEAEKMKVQIGDKTFTATLEENDAAQSFIRMMETAPIVIKMSDYAGFEKVGALGTSLPASNSQITAKAGDIVLYNGNQIVIFYGSNSWSYTMLGKIDDLTGWEETLGNGDVTVTFSID